MTINTIPETVPTDREKVKGGVALGVVRPPTISRRVRHRVRPLKMVHLLMSSIQAIYLIWLVSIIILGVIEKYFAKVQNAAAQLNETTLTSEALEAVSSGIHTQTIDGLNEDSIVKMIGIMLSMMTLIIFGLGLDASTPGISITGLVTLMVTELPTIIRFPLEGISSWHMLIYGLFTLVSWCTASSSKSQDPPRKEQQQQTWKSWTLKKARLWSKILWPLFYRPF